MITVIGAGAGEAENLSVKALNTLLTADKIFLKTEKMPLAAHLDDKNVKYSTLDYIFESSNNFDLLNSEIASLLAREENCCYVVFGSALDDTSVAVLKDWVDEMYADGRTTALSNMEMEQKIATLDLGKELKNDKRRQNVNLPSFVVSSLIP